MFINYFIGHRKTVEAQAEEILDVIFDGILTDGERRRRRGQQTSPKRKQGPTDS
jgi:hypothetical protein